MKSVCEVLQGKTQMRWKLHFNYHCVFSVDACGDEGANSKHRSLPSSQLDLTEPASCLRGNWTPIQEY